MQEYIKSNLRLSGRVPFIGFNASASSVTLSGMMSHSSILPGGNEELKISKVENCKHERKRLFNKFHEIDKLSCPPRVNISPREAVMIP